MVPSPAASRSGAWDTDRHDQMRRLTRQIGYLAHSAWLRRTVPY
jgi:hypothetical protein